VDFKTRLAGQMEKQKQPQRINPPETDLPPSAAPSNIVAAAKARKKAQQAKSEAFEFGANAEAPKASPVVEEPKPEPKKKAVLWKKDESKPEEKKEEPFVERIDKEIEEEKQHAETVAAVLEVFPGSKVVEEKEEPHNFVEQIVQEKATPKPQEKPRPGFVLLVDCLPIATTRACTTAQKLLAIAGDKLGQNYKLFDYGQGPGLLCAAVESLVESLSSESDLLVLLSTTTPEERDTLGVFEKYARETIRGIR
jgi:hypothetical protein